MDRTSPMATEGLFCHESGGPEGMFPYDLEEGTPEGTVVDSPAGSRLLWLRLESSFEEEEIVSSWRGSAGTVRIELGAR